MSTSTTGYVLAVNHAGWNVEILGAGGWKPMFGPEIDRDFVEDYCKGLQAIMPDSEFRVYEALT